MAGNLSYLEIVASCKLADYYDFSYGTKEVWDDGNSKMYVCIWLPQNTGEFPSTIEVL